MAHNSFAPGSRTPEIAPSRANLPLLSTSRANLPLFCSKVLANCDFDEDDYDRDNNKCQNQIEILNEKKGGNT